jgi:hypothetical protein
VVPLHAGLPHWTEVEPCWQAPAPLQTPVLPQVPPTGQPPCGSAVPVATLTQTPLPPPQTWQVGQLATPQQTLSTQLPLPHSIGSAQLWPFPFLSRHIPFGPVQ